MAITYSKNKRDKFKKWITFEPKKTVYASYDLKFDSNFEWIKGGKLLGLCGEKCTTGSKKINKDGW